MGYMLLPFAHGIDQAAIEQAILLAQDHQATLVPLSLICLAGQKKAARLEHIQQSKDFLTLVQQKARRAAVVVHPLERYTCEEVETIQQMAMELNCIGILLFAREQQGILLSSATVRQVMENHKRPCFLSSLPALTSPFTLAQWPLKKLSQARQRAAHHARQMTSFSSMRSVVEI